MNQQELKAIRAKKYHVNSILRRIFTLRARVTNITQELTDVSTGHAQRDRLAEYVAQLDELERELTQAIVDNERDMQRIDAYIDRLPQQQATAIRMRYFEGLSWRGVAGYMHYSVGHVKKIHTAAIKNLCENER